jgi:membrane-associated phospholipid phosphatase
VRVFSVCARPLMSPRLRHGAIAVACASATITAVLGVWYAGDSSPGRLDRAVDARLTAGLGEHHELADTLVSIGSPIAVTVMTVLLVAALLFLRWPRAALLAALGPSVASAITEWVLKPLFGRTQGGALAYPSGHTTGIFAVALVVLVLMLDRTPQRLPVSARLVISTGAVAIAAAVAIASVVAGDHYATDTVGGACVAIASVLGLSLIVDALADRRRHGESSAQPA